MGLEPHARVMIRLENRPEFAFVFFSAIAAGLVPLPCSPQLQANEIAFLAEDSEASLIIHSASLPLPNSLPPKCQQIDFALFNQEVSSEGVEPFIQTNAEDPAFLIYTSGTTGFPKGVLHAHRHIWGRRPMRQGWFGGQENDIFLHTGQLNWTYTLGVGVMDPWSIGATVVLFGGEPTPQVWLELIETFKVTIFASVPGWYRQILKYCDLSQYDLSSLRHALTAGEALSEELLNKWHEVAKVELFEALGMSEISTYISSGPKTPIKIGSPGKPQSGRTVVILPVEGGTEPLPPGQMGLIGIHRSDPGLMLGYWKRPEEEAEVFRNDWFIGGDLGEIDEEGYIWYHGRNNDLMNSMGYRVSPLEVEKVFLKHPEVLEAAVTEISIEDSLSLIFAFLVVSSQIPLTLEDFYDWAHTHLAKYKCPREICFVKMLPRTPNGKLIRRLLTKQFFKQNSGKRPS